MRSLQHNVMKKELCQLKQFPPSPLYPRFRLWQGDITRLNVDAIVNAANSQMLGRFIPLHKCIDNAIHSAAGMELREECSRIMRAQGHEEPTGKAKITPGYNLPARYAAANRYEAFINRYAEFGKVVLFELGIGYNTPTIINTLSV